MESRRIESLRQVFNRERLDVRGAPANRRDEGGFHYPLPSGKALRTVSHPRIIAQLNANDRRERLCNPPTAEDRN